MKRMNAAGTYRALGRIAIYGNFIGNVHEATEKITIK
jgi:hypothetical protein